MHYNAIGRWKHPNALDFVDFLINIDAYAQSDIATFVIMSTQPSKPIVPLSSMR